MRSVMRSAISTMVHKFAEDSSEEEESENEPGHKES